ncbi:MAG TPA: CRTAC1 family protein [Thermoanaerobaculia bacterium]|nr:CRTAC1 family protein [Thermoanaerobaculia bacterium]
MNRAPRPWLRRHAVRIAALLLVLVAYGFARLPHASETERQRLAARFAFTRLPLVEPPHAGEPRTVRPVHPSLREISGWISSVGAAVALADVDGDGLPNDSCLVDPRFDQAIVAPVPGTGERYAVFVLDPRPFTVDATMAPMGCLPGDFNEDGRTDFVVTYWGRPPLAFLRRAGDATPGAAAYRAVELAPTAERWFTNAITSADVDGDGHLDLVIGNYFRDGAHILDARGTGEEILNTSLSRATNGGTNRVLLWRSGSAGDEPDVRFADLQAPFDEATRFAWTLAVGAADLDGDLLPEIYFGNDFGNDRLLYNRSDRGEPRFTPVFGERGFTDPASRVLGRDSFKGMGIDFADLNGDGVLDLYVSNIAQPWALQESHFVWMSDGPPAQLRDGVAPYRDRGEELGLARSGWSWDARFADFDNDGVPEAVQAVGFVRGEVNRWPELHEIAMGNDWNFSHPRFWHHVRPGDDLSGHLHDPLFVRGPDGRYEDLAAELGLDDSHVSRGIAIADVDGDGDLDFAVANQFETSYFFRNDAPHAGAAMELDLRLPAAAAASAAPAASRPAIGAAATLRLPDGRRLVAQVDGGSGHSGERAPLLHFGLGALPAHTPLRVELRWRDGDGRPHTGALTLAPGRHCVLLDGDAPRLLAAAGAEG